MNPTPEQVAAWAREAQIAFCLDKYPNYETALAALVCAWHEERDGKDAGRYRWLRDISVPPHNFYLSVPDEFDGIRYTPKEVDEAIDAAIRATADAINTLRAALALARAEQAEPVKHADNCGVFDERDFCTCTSPPAPVQAVEPLTESEMNRSWFLACKEIIDRCVAPDMYADARGMLDKALYESMIAAAPPLPKGGA